MSGLRRTLSSRQTFFAKVVSPTFWIGGVGAVVLWLVAGGEALLDPGGRAPAEAKWLLLVIWLAGCAFAMSSIRFKRVRMDDRALLVSNYLIEAAVPLADVVAVRENTWLRTHPVTIELRRRSDLGDRIVFMPSVRWLTWWTPHPVVREIQAAVDRVRTEASPTPRRLDQPD